jgi:hypothetical protein
VSDLLGVLPPRKVYAALSACPSAEDRARTALLFLHDGTDADGGFLFLARDIGVALAAAMGPEAEPTPELIEHVNRAWAARREPQSDLSRTLDATELKTLLAAEDPRWVSPSGDAFERRVLSVHRGGRWIPVGVAMLRRTPGRAMRPMRRAHVEALCNALIDAGDIHGGHGLK